MKKLLATPLGTFIKGFASIVLTMWLTELSAGHDLFTMDYELAKKLMTAGLIANLPIIINWFNPEYKNYGKEKIEPIL
jgi:hypothetical protein